jgi:hypothetical protein
MRAFMTGVVAEKPFNTSIACISRDFLQESLQVETKQRDARNLREEGHVEM